jgi:hypothetical protein
VNKQTFKAKATSYWGKKLQELKTADGKLYPHRVLKFNATFDAFGPNKPTKRYTAEDWQTAYNEWVASGGKMSIEDIVRAANNKAKNAARSKSLGVAVDAAGLQKPELKTDRDLQLKTFVTTYVALGHSEEDALEMAKDALKAAAERLARKQAEQALAVAAAKAEAAIAGTLVLKPEEEQESDEESDEDSDEDSEDEDDEQS